MRRGFLRPSSFPDVLPFFLSTASVFWSGAGPFPSPSRSHIPKSHFFTTIEILLSYKNGMLLNLLSEYLFDANDHENSDAILLSQISACIIRIHDSIKDNATTLKE